MVSFHAPNLSSSTTYSSSDFFSDARSETSSFDGFTALFEPEPNTMNQIDGNGSQIPSGGLNQQGVQVEPDSTSVNQPTSNATTATEQLMLNALTAGLAAGQITQGDFIDAVAKMRSSPAVESQSVVAGPYVSRARQAVDTSTPIFRGDNSDRITCGRWIEQFEREARYHDLPQNDWPIAAAKRFPADSNASNWVDTVFGTGLRFTATWVDFRSDFLKQFTAPDALAVAKAEFDRLRLGINGDVLAFNIAFTNIATRLDCVLRDSGLPELTQAEVCLAYQVKLHGGVRMHIDQYISNRKQFNEERLADGREIREITPRQLLATTQAYASQQSIVPGPGDFSALPRSTETPTTSALPSTTTPMDLDTMKSALKEEIAEQFNALKQSFRQNRVPRSEVECFECKGKGHYRRECPNRQRREKKNKEGEEGKGSTQ